MARTGLKSARAQLSGNPWFTSILVILALGIWMWNAKSLWQQRQPGRTELTLPDTLPDLPEIDHQTKVLPPLEKDPFLGAIAPPKPKVPQPKPQKKPIKKAPPPPKPPQGKLLMILKRQGEFAAVFHFRGMDPEVFFEGDRYEDWTVREITLQTVTWFHKPTEKTHVAELP